MTVQLSVDFNLKDKLHGILCSNDLEHYLKDCISCYTVCVIVICLLYQIMNNTVILKFAVCQISLISPMIKKSDKSPPMMNGDEGGQLSDLIGGDTVLMRGDIRLIGGIPPSPPPLGKTLPTPILKSVPSQFSPCVCEITNTCHVLRNNSFPKSTQRKTNFKQLKHKVFSVSPTHAREARKRGTQHKSQFQHVQSTVNELYE